MRWRYVRSSACAPKCKANNNSEAEKMSELDVVPSAKLGGQKRDTKQSIQATKTATKSKSSGPKTAMKSKRSGPKTATKSKSSKVAMKSKSTFGPKTATKCQSSKALGAKTGMTTHETGQTQLNKFRVTGKRSESTPRANMQIALPCTLVTRTATKTRPAEAYMVQNSKTCKYICGITQKKSNEFKEIVSEMIERANSGGLSTVGEAKAWLMERANRV